MIYLTECPRDAMQGIKTFIPTEQKVEYLNLLLKVGFYALDLVSFVSPDAIPQMADSEEVISKISKGDSKTRLIAIIANERGAKTALKYPIIDDLGFPFSVSETFQKKNTNSSILESLSRVEAIKKISDEGKKRLIVYISMGFGNNYGDPYSPQVVEDWVAKLATLGITKIMLSDTVGVANPEIIEKLFSSLIPKYPEIEIGAHLHTAPHNWLAKIETAHKNGCSRFDAVIRGFGGCPMAEDDLIGNMPTENLLNYFDPATDFGSDFSIKAFEEALRYSATIFH